MSACAYVLLISPYPEDHVTLGMILREKEWPMRHALSWAEAEQLLEGPCQVVITEASIDDRCWRDVLERAGRVPLVVASSTADDHLWSEVLNLGGYNVLAKPFDTREVNWVLRNASDQGPSRKQPQQAISETLQIIASA